jgi:hypothetical protein
VGVGVTSLVAHPRRALALVLLVTALMYLPSLGTGLFGDDYWWILGLSAPEGDAGVYRMAFDPDADFWRRHGVGPWWITPDFRWVLFRPLYAAVLAWEWRAFGTADAPWQLPGLVAYLGMVAMTWPLYRRLAEPAVALLATFVFATHFSHLQAVWWVSNGHTPLAGVPALGALVAYLAWREDGWRPGLPLAALGIVVGLLASETALAALVFAMAWEIAGGRVTRDRAVAFAGLAGVGVVYVAAHGAMGNGIDGSSAYADPRASLPAWAAQLVAYAPALVSSALGLVPSDAWVFFPRFRPAILAGGLLGPVVLALLLRPVWPTLPEITRRGARFATFGAIGAIPLVAGAPVGGRLALWMTVGTSFVVALVVRETWRRRGALALPGRVALVGLAAILAFGPVGGAARLRVVARLAGELRKTAVDAELDPGREVVAVTRGDPMEAVWLLPTRLVARGEAAPPAFAVLSAAVADHRVARPAADVLVVEVLGSSMWRHAFERLFLSPARAPVVGEPWPAGALTATVLAADDAGPTRVAFRFPAPLDDPRYQFVAWQDGRLARFELPEVGGTRVLPWSPAPMNTAP